MSYAYSWEDGTTPYKPATGQTPVHAKEVAARNGFRHFKVDDSSLRTIKRIGPDGEIKRTTVLTAPEGTLKLRLSAFRGKPRVKVREAEYHLNYTTTGEDALTRMLTRLALTPHRGRPFWVVKRHKVVSRGVIGAYGTVPDGSNFSSIDGWADFKEIDSLSQADKARIYKATYDRPEAHTCLDCDVVLKSPHSKRCKPHQKAHNAAKAQAKRKGNGAIRPEQLDALMSQFQRNA